MARVFDITTPSDKATIKPGETARFVFTVTNTTKNTLRGELSVKRIDPPWAGVKVMLAGEELREFSPGQAHQVKIEVTAEAGSAAGNAKVQLRASEEFSGDENYTLGPPVGITVTPDFIPNDDHKPRTKWWIYAVGAVAVLAVGGLVAWLLNNGEPPDPALPVIPADLKGKEYADAKQRLEQMGLIVHQTQASIRDDCPGKVVSTVPVLGASAPKGGTVMVTVGALADGPTTCRPPFVHRLAVPDDRVCVPPESQARAKQDNALQSERTELVVATAKDFDEIQKDTPAGGTVAKGNFSALAVHAPGRIFIDQINSVPRVRRCKHPFTERRATPTDWACVTRPVQQATDAENTQGPARRACVKP
jgi:hypothetical protein